MFMTNELDCVEAEQILVICELCCETLHKAVDAAGSRVAKRFVIFHIFRLLVKLDLITRILLDIY